MPSSTERSIEPAEIDHELLAFIVDRYRRGEPLPSLGKRVPELLAHILWLRSELEEAELQRWYDEAGESA